MLAAAAVARPFCVWEATISVSLSLAGFVRATNIGPVDRIIRRAGVCGVNRERVYYFTVWSPTRICRRPQPKPTGIQEVSVTGNEDKWTWVFLE